MLGWVFAVGGGVRVHVHQDGQGGMRGGQNELGWVRIGESLTDVKGMSTQDQGTPAHCHHTPLVPQPHQIHPNILMILAKYVWIISPCVEMDCMVLEVSFDTVKVPIDRKSVV